MFHRHRERRTKYIYTHNSIKHSIRSCVTSIHSAFLFFTSLTLNFIAAFGQVMYVHKTVSNEFIGDKLFNDLVFQFYFHCLFPIHRMITCVLRVLCHCYRKKMSQQNWARERHELISSIQWSMKCNGIADANMAYIIRMQSKPTSGVEWNDR